MPFESSKRDSYEGYLVGPFSGDASVIQKPIKGSVFRRRVGPSLAGGNSHRTFRVDAPDQSGFVLVRGGQAEVLTLRQLHALDLSRVELAVLASCWSADNFILPGRWVISLPQTLRSAAAHSVIASLWEVDDRLAPKFLARFYERLSSLSLAEALRRTQLDCLQKKLMNFDVSSPFYWASYSLYGATGRISLRLKG